MLEKPCLVLGTIGRAARCSRKRLLSEFRTLSPQNIRWALRGDLSSGGARPFVGRRTLDVDEIGRTLDRDARTVHHMCVNHRRADILVPQQLLHGADVGAIVQKMRRKTMPQRMGNGILANSDAAHCALELLAECGLASMVSQRFSTTWVF